MLRKVTQWTIDSFSERSMSSVAAYIGSALQRMLILGHLEHHNQLEEEALRYEAEGKPRLAAILREQAAKLTLEDPLAGARAIASNLNEPGSHGGFPLAIEEEPPTKRGSRGSRKTPEIGAARPSQEGQPDA